MNIPFIDLKSQYLQHEKEIKAAIERVLQHGSFIMGPEVEQLEGKLATFAGVRNVVTCSSGTDALLMPLLALGVGPGDAVFTTPFTFVATAEVIALLGATPVFVDIDPRTFNINPNCLAEAVADVIEQGKLTPRVIIPVDLFGLPADYDAIRKVARQYGLFVLEDAAQGFGGSYNGRMAGSLGDAAGTSFFPAKPLGCYGDGGAILTDDDELAGKLRSIRVHGKGGHKYDNVRIGLNARLDTLQAAILLPKLVAFPTELKERERAAAQYTEGLAGLSDYLLVPWLPEGYRSAWAQYSLLVEQRGRFQEELRKVGVPTMIYYPKPLHLQEVFAYLGYEEGSFPVSEMIARNIVSLPMHPYLARETIEFILVQIQKTVKAGGMEPLTELRKLKID